MPAPVTTRASDPPVKPAALPTTSGGSVRLGSLPSNSGDGLAFVQERLALYSRWTATIGGGFWVLGFVNGSTDPASPIYVWAHSNLAHGAAVVMLILAWLFTRRRQPLPATALTFLDAGIVVVACLAWAVMAKGIGADRGYFIGTLAVLQTCILRAVLVPSTARRALWTTALANVPMIVVGSLMVDSVALPPGLTAKQQLIGVTMGSVTWGASCVAICWLAARVIYGLQEKVRTAQQLGQYTLERPIGAGGMGTVYRARHALLRRATAVKLISGDVVSEPQLRRFEQEVQLTSQLTHPNTVTVYDYGRTPDGVFYYAMEYLDGLDLGALVRAAGPQPAERVIHMLVQVCGALEEAHGVGLIHRDIKPENILVCERGGVADFVKVLDFGLAKEIGEGAAALTTENVIAGTPHYMAPEVLRRKDVDARSDLYALGCVAFFVLTGRTVFDGDSVPEVCGHHLHTAAPPPSSLGVDVPADLESVVLACLAKDPEKRPASAAELRGMLLRCQVATAWTTDRAKTFWKQLAPPDGDAIGAADTIAVTMGVDLEGRVA